eukprot:5881522-Prymnesium_polylepis.1
MQSRTMPSPTSYMWLAPSRSGVAYSREVRQGRATLAAPLARTDVHMLKRVISSGYVPVPRTAVRGHHVIKRP